MTEVYYAAESPIEAESNIFSGSTYEHATLYVPEAAVEKCSRIDPWKNFKSIETYVPSSVRYVNLDSDQPVMLYNLNGAYMGGDAGQLAPGLYIERHGNNTRKIVVNE